jgi:hypothetical protein
MRISHEIRAGAAQAGMAEKARAGEVHVLAATP